MADRVLIACERSQVVCCAFRAYGIEAFSCDILPPYGQHPEWHILGDALEVAYSGEWSLMIAHPPCTYLSNAGNAHLFMRDGSLNADRLSLMASGRDFFLKLWNAPIPRICLENPKPSSLARLPLPSQHIEPYYFGDPFSKFTYLWLRRLPGLMATCLCSDYVSWTRAHSSPRLRSQTFPGIAAAMAAQWRSFCA